MSRHPRMAVVAIGSLAVGALLIAAGFLIPETCPAGHPQASCIFDPIPPLAVIGAFISLFSVLGLLVIYLPTQPQPLDRETIIQNAKHRELERKE